MIHARIEQDSTRAGLEYLTLPGSSHNHSSGISLGRYPFSPLPFTTASRTCIYHLIISHLGSYLLQMPEHPESFCLLLTQEARCSPRCQMTAWRGGCVPSRGLGGGITQGWRYGVLVHRTLWPALSIMLDGLYDAGNGEVLSLIQGLRHRCLRSMGLKHQITTLVCIYFQVIRSSALWLNYAFFTRLLLENIDARLWMSFIALPGVYVWMSYVRTEWLISSIPFTIKSTPLLDII